MPQKSCAKAKETLNLSKCMNYLPSHKAHYHPGQTLQRLRYVAHVARSLFHSPYIATYHSHPFILSKLFSQVDKHEKNMTYPGLFKRDFLLNMIHCALISHCIFIKCSMPALKRTLSTLVVMADFFDSIVYALTLLPTCNRKIPSSRSSGRCPKEPLGVWRQTIQTLSHKHVSSNCDVPGSILSAMVPTIKRAYIIPTLMEVTF